jgi:pimeloyl-ACP methyl ester carboxylesterase
MSFFPRVLGPVLGVLLAASWSYAQPVMVQDSTLNNLVHAPDYVTSAPGSLGAVVERGTGPVPMVLVSGFGLGASAFEGFMSRNAARYRMYAVTLPGFEGTAAPPMPPPGTSYGDQTWTRAAAEAVAELIRSRKLDRPVLVGHSLNGTQVVMRVAVDHPELTRAVVLLAGSPRFEPMTMSQSWPKNLSIKQKVRGVDELFAPRWFKTVTRATWVSNNFKATDYSVDSVLGKRFADRANAAPLPVLVRYMCEYHASDGWLDMPRLQHPMLVMVPQFTPKQRADSTLTYLPGFFIEPWKGFVDAGGQAEGLEVEKAGIMVMEDQPAFVDRKIAEFLKRLVQ